MTQTWKTTCDNCGTTIDPDNTTDHNMLQTDTKNYDLCTRCTELALDGLAQASDEAGVASLITRTPH